MTASPPGSVRHIRIMPVAATVTPYTAVPSVTYSASVGGRRIRRVDRDAARVEHDAGGVGDGRVHIVVARGAWPIVACVFGGGAVTTP